MNLLILTKLLFPYILLAFLIYSIFLFFITTKSYLNEENWSLKIENILKYSFNFLCYIFSLGIVFLILIFIAAFILILLRKSSINNLKIATGIFSIILGFKICRDIYLFFYKGDKGVFKGTVDYLLAPVFGIFSIYIVFFEKSTTPFMSIIRPEAYESAINSSLFLGKKFIPPLVVLIILCFYKRTMMFILKNYISLLDKVDLKERLKKR